MSIVFLGLGVLLPAAAVSEPDPAAEVKKLASDWVKTRLETTRIEAEWKSQRQLLESTVESLSERAKTLEEKRDFLATKTAKDREEVAALTASAAAATTALEPVEGRVKDMSERLLRLRPSLPPRLSTALELPFRSLAGSNLSVGERMQLNMTVLNRCIQFNRSITCEEEVLGLEEGRNAQVLEVVYWGLSHGYALDHAAGKAWLGTPGPQGWKWEAHPEAVAAVTELIAIHRDKADPNFVPVPVRLGHPGGEPAK